MHFWFSMTKALDTQKRCTEFNFHRLGSDNAAVSILRGSSNVDCGSWIQIQIINCWGSWATNFIYNHYEFESLSCACPWGGLMTYGGLSALRPPPPWACSRPSTPTPRHLYRIIKVSGGATSSSHTTTVATACNIPATQPRGVAGRQTICWAW